MFKHLLAKTVTLPRPERAMVGRPIALHREDVSAGTIRMANAKIDLEANRSDLVIDKVAHPSDFGCNVSFKWSIGFLAGRYALVDYSRLGIIKKSFEDARPFKLRFRQVHLAGIKRTKYFAADASAREEDIKPSLTPFVVDGAKTHRGLTTGCARSVAYAHQNDVSLIALDVFDILDEHVLASTLSEKAIERRVLSPLILQKFGNEIALRE